MRKGVSNKRLIILGKNFLVLKRVIALLARANLNDVLNIVDKNLAVAYMSGIKRFLRRLDNGADGNLAYDHLYLHLGQKARLQLNAAVIFGLALLNAAAHNVSYGDAGDTDCHKRGFESFKHSVLADDFDFGELMLARSRIIRLAVDLHSLGNGNVTADDHGRIVNTQQRCSGSKVRVCARQSMLGAVKPRKLFISVNTQTYTCLDKLEYGNHRCGSPRHDGNNAQRLYAEEMQAAAVEQSAVDGEKSNRQSTPNAVCKMNSNRANRVVDMKLEVEKFNRYYNKDAGNSAYDDRAESVNARAACGNCNKTYLSE